MNLVIFGLSITSSWGNGHATLWRALCRSLVKAGHKITFFERDVPYYAEHRDLRELHGGEIVLFSNWNDVLPRVRTALADSDAAIVTSYCPDALAASDEIFSSDSLSVFYDLDTPITLARLSSGEGVDYIGERGLSDYELVLSYTGGSALSELKSRLGAKQVAPLYGSVDPDEHRPAQPKETYAADLSYLGTFAADRQAALESLFVEPARRRPEYRFVMGGAQYPHAFPWTSNIYFVQHLPPAEHSPFFCSSRLTLNITRQAMAQMGWCPSGRLFEAAACGAPLISDWWEGIESFYTPGSELLLANHADDVLGALSMSPSELRRIAQAARERTLDEHHSRRRAAELERFIEDAHASRSIRESLCGA